MLVLTQNTVPMQTLAEYAEHARGAFAHNTERALRSDTAVWSSWCSEHNVNPIPASPETLAQFVDALGQTKAVATVRRYLASIAHLHRAAGLEDPTCTVLAKLALKRLARTKGTRQKQAEPLTIGKVLEVCDQLGSSMKDKRDRALLLVMRDMLARRSEVAALDVEDINPGRDGSATVIVRRGKTDQEGMGVTLWLSPTTAVAVQTWLTAGSVDAGAVFRNVTKNGKVGSRLTPDSIARVIKQRAGNAFSGHSCRVGMAQDLVAHGADLAAVMQAGRWKSPAMPARYAERLLAGRNAVARFHGSTS